MLPVIAVMNLIVGTLVGVSGIAGFLLPIVFTGYLGMDLSPVSYTHLTLPTTSRV